MSHARSYDALVLLTRDIGEADRFCILFTREAGRRAARARGVRKTGSRLGGLLLPLRHVSLELEERGQHATIVSARDSDVSVRSYADVAAFSVLMQGVELLLRFTEDDEPLPRIFDLLLAFRDAAADGLPDPFLPFRFSFLHLLGYLPVTVDDARFKKLSDIARSFVRCCAGNHPFPALCAMPGDRAELRRFLDDVFSEHLTRPLSAGMVAEAMRI